MTTERLHLVRKTPNDKDGIYGVLKVPEYRMDGKKVIRLFDTAERPWLDNKVNESCIPTGTYPVKPRRVGSWAANARKKFGHKFAIEICDVPGRSEILIHWGNWPMKNSLGCVLVGKRMKNEHEKFIGHSQKTFQALYKVINDLFIESDRLEIVVKNASS